MERTLAAATLAVLLAARLGGAAGNDAPAPAAPTFVGPEVCTACHEERARPLAETPHAVLLAESARPAAERGCEACHGPGSTHAEAAGGTAGSLQSFKPIRTAADRSAPCLRCHGGTADLHGFRRSAHAVIACTDCHTVHTSRADHLLQTAPPQLCYGCHANVKAAFALPERHDVDRGAVGCLDCHRPHGGRDRAALRGANDRPCLVCHAEVQGPFVFEHAVTVTEGCTACHAPHGSVNRHLLLRQQVAQLCSECHAATPASHVQPRHRDCTRCHVDIHGSNVDPRFLGP